jgi:hypothetical protein
MFLDHCHAATRKLFCPYSSFTCVHWRTQGAGLPGCRPPPPPHQKRNLKNADFVDTILSKVVRDLRFNLNQPMKSADDWYSGSLEGIIKTYKYVDFFFSS